MTKCFRSILAITLLGAGLAIPAQAQPKHNLDEIGKKLANPVSDVWALFTEFDFAWNDGDLNSGSDRVSYTTLFQPVMPIKFTENSKLITRPTIPIIWSQPVPGSDGRGGIDFDRKHGLGAEYSVAHEDDFGKRWLIKLNIIPVIAPLIKNPIF